MHRGYQAGDGPTLIFMIEAYVHESGASGPLCPWLAISLTGAAGGYPALLPCCGPCGAPLRNRHTPLGCRTTRPRTRVSSRLVRECRAARWVYPSQPSAWISALGAMVARTKANRLSDDPSGTHRIRMRPIPRPTSSAAMTVSALFGGRAPMGPDAGNQALVDFHGSAQVFTFRSSSEPRVCRRVPAHGVRGSMAVCSPLVSGAARPAVRLR